MMRELINGSLEPLWRMNARRNADMFKAELMAATVSTRREFLARAGGALLLEYVAQRRAIALPLPIRKGGGGPGGSVNNGPPPATGSIYIQRLGPDTTFQWLPDALFAMQNGDTLILPAGPTYLYGGQTYYYANHNNTDWDASGHRSGSGFGDMYLGSPASGQGGLLNADYGTVQGDGGSANNGRALITPPYGILAADFHTTDTEMCFIPSTPVTNFATSYTAWLCVPGSFSNAQFSRISMSYTGLDVASNGLTGVSGNTVGTIPAGTVVTTQTYNQNKALIIAAGQNPGWTFTNLELAYTGNGDCSSFRQSGSNPGGPYVGSMTINNCYVHDCGQGVGIGYSGIGNTPVFCYMFDTELTRMGMYYTQEHNIYIGHIGEFLMDNCYSHYVTGAWLVKSRAALNIVTYSQIRSERTDANTDEAEGGGCDFSNGGLTYLIGNIHQHSLHPGNRNINYCAERGNTAEGGGLNALQEIYIINCTLIGSASGVDPAPVQLYNIGVNNPAFTPLSQTSSGSLPARSYFVALTSTGASGGETTASPLSGPVGGGTVYEMLNVSASNLLTVASPPQGTGTGGWNCYSNYSDPFLYVSPLPWPQRPTIGTYFYWDAGFISSVFGLTTGGATISLTGTVTNGSTTITGLTGLGGLASIGQLYQMTVYVNGVNSQLYVQSVDLANNALVLNLPYSGTSGSATLTFGYFLWCGLSYQTALGDSITAAAIGGNISNSNGLPWYDGSYTRHSKYPYFNAAVVQVPPGNKLIVKAPPSGPSWATGVNFWAVPTSFNVDYSTGVTSYGDTNYGGLAGSYGLTKQNASPIAFGGSWTSNASVIAPRAGQLGPRLFLQNASSLAIGTNFTEPSTGLANHNSTQNKLQWYRRAGLTSAYGGTMDCWYAIVPTGGLSSYQETIAFDTPSASCNGSVSIWRGCAANPFDANFLTPIATLAPNALSVSTAAGHVTVIGGFRSGGTAAAGWTQLVASMTSYANVFYQSFTAAQTGLTVTESGGPATLEVLVDALVGASAPPSLVSSVTINGSGSFVNFTIAAANAGDVLYLMLGEASLANVASIGSIGPPMVGNAVGISPVCVIQNCIGANFNPSTTGGWTIRGENGGVVPAANVTLATNLAMTPYNGSTFGTPAWATVFADATQSDYDYRMASGSPALSSASNPGTSPHGQDLVPYYQSAWHGSPTPGTPIPAKATRSDIGSGKTGTIGALSN